MPVYLLFAAIQNWIKMMVLIDSKIKVIELIYTLKSKYYAVKLVYFN